MGYAYAHCFTLKRNSNATLLQRKIHEVLFKVLDGDNEPSSFQEMLILWIQQSSVWKDYQLKRNAPIYW